MFTRPVGGRGRVSDNGPVSRPSWRTTHPHTHFPGPHPLQGSSHETLRRRFQYKPFPRQQRCMGRPFSKLTRSAKTAGNPRVPQELVSEVLDHLVNDTATLRSCSLVTRSWIYPSRRHLFNTILFTADEITKWNRSFPYPEDSPARLVRDLSFCFMEPDVPIDFADRIPHFSNVRKLTLIGLTAIDPGFIHALGQLPPSTRSVGITFSEVLTTHITSVMRQLPNLDDLSLMSHKWGGPIPPGTGKLIQCKLNGKLRLRRQSAHQDLLNMLMEVPTGPQFAEVEIRDARMECFPATLKLVMACQDTLTRLHFSTLVQGIFSLPPARKVKSLNPTRTALRRPILRFL